MILRTNLAELMMVGDETLLITLTTGIERGRFSYCLFYMYIEILYY